jgi:hypothetical protein
MRLHLSLGNGLLRAAVSLGFLSCLIATSEAANPSNVSVAPLAPGLAASSCHHDVSPIPASDSMLFEQREIGLPDESNVPFEDSIEVFRVDIQERAFGLDQVEIGPKVGLKVARTTRLNISPPLLV